MSRDKKKHAMTTTTTTAAAAAAAVAAASITTDYLDENIRRNCNCAKYEYVKNVFVKERR